MQTLFYATRNSAAETGALHEKLATLGELRADGLVAIAAGNIMPRHEVLNAKRAAEATAQDGACALILILDNAIRRMRRHIAPTDTRTLGPAVRNGVKLNRAIWALANQARHADDWESKTEDELAADEKSAPSVGVLRALAYGPKDLNAAREFICAIPARTYIEFEDMLLASAHEVLIGTGWHLSMVSAGTSLLEPDTPGG